MERCQAPTKNNLRLVWHCFFIIKKFTKKGIDKTIIVIYYTS